MKVNHSIKKGISFGLTSGIITTLGLMVGLSSSTNSSKVVIGGILVIAIADAMSDGLGVHISEESECKHTTREIWESTFYTFLTKFIFASLFIIPILLFSLATAVIVSIIIGLILIALFSCYIARERKEKSYKLVLEHLAIAVLVIVATNFVGKWTSKIFE